MEDHAAHHELNRDPNAIHCTSHAMRGDSAITEQLDEIPRDV